MSAYTPKADMTRTWRDVRYVPRADIQDTDSIFVAESAAYHRDNRQGVQLAIRRCAGTLLTLGRLDGGHPIKVGRRKIVREHIRIL